MSHHVVIVTGERDWKDRETIYRVLDEALEAWLDGNNESRWMPHSPELRARFVLRHGVCEGADWIANDWGKERGVTIERFPAQWKVPVTGAYDPSAGPRRNREMAQAEPRADRLIAFWSGKMRVKYGKKEYSGTLNMIQAALDEGIPVSITPPRKEAE
jgi:YspA, cpYpsA-related SLOG family